MCSGCRTLALGGMVMKITVNGQEREARAGETILELCRREGIFIPTFCYHPAFGGQGACRMCMVELKEKGQKNSRLVASCTYPINSPVEVMTESARIQRLRRTIVMLLKRRAATHPLMEELARSYEAPGLAALTVNPPNCILCGLCIHACEEMGKSAIWSMFRGIDKRVATPYDEAAGECMGCGACARVCPTQAISLEEDETGRKIWNKTFSLVACERCGKNFATQEQWEFLCEHSSQSQEPLCENCRKKVLAASIKNFQQ